MSKPDQCKWCTSELTDDNVRYIKLDGWGYAAICRRCFKYTKVPNKRRSKDERKR